MRTRNLLVVTSLLAGGIGTLDCGGSTTSETGVTTTTTTGHGGEAGTGGQGTGATAGGTGGSGAQGGSGNAGGAGGGTCNADNCNAQYFTCCGDVCTNPNNDILNCNSCNHPCPGPHPYCDQGTCAEPPCTGTSCASPQFCCGGACCQATELCCTVPGPVEFGPQCTDPTPEGTCPLGCYDCVCASPDTPILTPAGERPIAELEVGDLVYSLDPGGVVVVPVVRTRRELVAVHEVVRLRLATSAVLEVSGPHPTADGRTFAALQAGDDLDGVAIVEREVVPYRHPFTYDILPASDTGSYFAAGVLVGSTLAAGGHRSP